MGFFNVQAIIEKSKLLHELEINGVKQDDEEETPKVEEDDVDNDYTQGGDGGEEPREGSIPPEDNDYTLDNGGETNADGEGGAESGSTVDNGGGYAGGSGEQPIQDKDASPADEAGDEEENDYLIPDDAEPETTSDASNSEEIENDYTGNDPEGSGEGEGEEIAGANSDPESNTSGVSDTGETEPEANVGDSDYVAGSEDIGGSLSKEGDTTNDYTSDGVNDTGEEQTSTEDEAQDAEGSENLDTLKATEDELLADLTPEQKQIQSDELRDNFIKMYTTVLDIIDKVNNVHKDEATMPIFEFISSQLIVLKDLINITITRTFDTKTYYENNITYGQCMAILITINKLIEETAKKMQSNQKD